MKKRKSTVDHEFPVTDDTSSGPTAAAIEETISIQ